MSPGEIEVDQAAAERFAVLRGELEQAVMRFEADGGDAGDAIICVGFLVGQLAARVKGGVPLAAILSSVANAAYSGHRTEIARQAAAARSLPTRVY